MKWTSAFGERLQQIAFETLLADLSSRFADVTARTVIAEIEAALAQLCDVFSHERCTYSEFGADGALVVLASAAAAGFAPLPKGPFADLPWLYAELRAGRVVALSEVPASLPEDAVAERELCQRAGLHSHLSVPLRARGRIAAVLSFSGLREARAWPADVVTRLRIVGEIFAGGLARARWEDETRRLRRRLWRADRVARVGALTAAIAHEINQPLAAILSNAQAGLALLERGDAAPQAMREILEAVVHDDKRAAEAIRSMRAMLRRDEGERERIDLGETLREVLQLLAAEVSRKGVHVTLDLQDGCWVRANKTQIAQVALNLVINASAAMEHSPAHERRLRVMATRTADERVAVAVTDSGGGIATEPLDAVFEPFWTTRMDGLGLGLAICRSIVEAHGGSIAIERNPDRGVTFRFDLPAAEADGAVPLAATARAVPVNSAAARSGPLLCLVDADAAARDSLARLLAAQGYALVSYPSAEAFLADAAFGEIGCVVLDLQLPGISGIALQERLAGTPGAPPLVFLTGSDDVAAGIAAMKRGAVDFLAKPVDGTLLLAAVRSALERNAGARMVALQRGALAERLARLSVREREVMEQVVQGRLNKQIAAALGIALQTVKQHRARVMEKMEARSVAELIRLLGPDQPPRAMIAASSTAPTAASEDPHSQGLPPA
jgi:FixJ family two-component response regulator/signal transduction histidine kinase